jgi:CHAT domain-containing protein
VPFAALVPPGGRQPLATTHDITVLPAAMLLETLRSGATPASPGRGVLAVAGAPRPNEAPLAGAVREVQDLARRFLDVQVWSAPGRAPVPSAIEGFRALHIAGHSVADDQFPWRSGFVVGRAADGGDSLLTAGDIAGRHLRERLVVLSSCESAGRRDHLGEGLAGFGTAFVAAGVPTVIATLWPVDDRVTADLMSAFYDELSQNRPASEALRRAQLRLRSRSATRHPHYWAGFVVIGDGDERLVLQKRPGWGLRLW